MADTDVGASSIPSADMNQAEELPAPANQQHRFREISEGPNTSPPLSVEMPGTVQEGINLVDMQSFEKPINNLPVDEPEAPGFFSTAFHTFKESEIAAHAIDFAYQKSQSHQIQQGIENQNPELNDVPEGWSPLETKNFEGFSPTYYPYIAGSKSPSELQARQQEVIGLMKGDEEYQDGSVWGKIAGFGGAVAVDIMLLKAIPIANSMQYARYGQSVTQNILRQAPGVIAGTGAYTVAIDATTTGKTASDVAEDFMVNTVAGLALVGAAAGLGRGMTGGKMYETRQALKMNFQGINAIHRVGEDGELLGMTAEFMPGVPQNAMLRTKAQEFLDSQMSRTGFFGVPYVGTALEKGLGKLSPVLRNLNSEWGTMRSYMNRMSDHSIEVQGVTDGRAQPDNYEFMLNQYRSSAVEMSNRVNGYQQEANGIVGDSAIDATKRLKQRITEGPMINDDEWGRTVMSARFNGEKSEIDAVNKLNDELDVHHAELLNEYQRSHGLEENDLPVKTAQAYLSRRYDTNYMATEKGEEVFHNTVTSWYAEGDARIKAAMEPLNSIESAITQTKENIFNRIDVEENQASLKRLNISLERANERLKESIRSDINSNNKEGLQNLLEENVLPSKADEEFLKNKLAPHNQSLAEVRASKKKLSSNKEKIRGERKKLETGGKNKDYEAIRKNITSLEERQSELVDEVGSLENKVKDEYAALMDDVESGEIRRALYYRDPETGKVSFRDPNQKPKFRPLYSRFGEDAAAEMRLNSEAAYAKIMGNDPDKIANHMMDTLSSRITGSPMKERSLLIPDSTLLDNSLLSTELAKNVSTYTLTIGRKIAHAKALEGFGATRGGLSGVFDELSKEFNSKRAAIKALNKPEKARDKLLKKLDGSYKAQQRELSALEAVASGTYSRADYSDGLRDVANALRSGSAATKLGNLPFLQIPDFAVSIYKNGMWRWLRDGITPLLTHMNGIIKTEAGVKWRKQASSVGLSLERSMHSKANELWNMQTTSGQTTAARVSDAAAWAAQKANTLSGSASIENMNQNIIANISSSTLIEHMYAYQNGTLNPRDLRKLLQFGIDPAKDAPILLRAFESSPSSISKKTGGYASDYWDWEDHEARVLMSKNIRKSVAATLIRKGMFDSPLVANDPVVGIAFTFTGWYFAALQRFAVPALQRPFDAYMMQGTMMSIGLGAVVDPLRSWSRGEEFKSSDEAWFASATSNSPVLAPLYSILMRANSIVDNKTLNKLKNDRYRNISITGGLGGASAGMVEDWAKGLRMFASGNLNKHDIKRLAHSMPLINQWYTNKMMTEFIDSLSAGLPNNY
jgi:hypothetical protein